MYMCIDVYIQTPAVFAEVVEARDRHGRRPGAGCRRAGNSNNNNNNNSNSNTITITTTNVVIITIAITTTAGPAGPAGRRAGRPKGPGAAEPAEPLLGGTRCAELGGVRGT